MFKSQTSELQLPCKQVISAETYDVKLLCSLNTSLTDDAVKKIKHEIAHLVTDIQKLNLDIQLDCSLCLVSKALKGYYAMIVESFYLLLFYKIESLI